MNKNLLKCLLLAVWACVSMDAAEVKPKRELVQRLEAIFYDPGFATIPDRVFAVADYGAKPGGETVQTKGIQAAIDAANQAGGGVVTFEPGTYVTGALFVKSHVELHLGEGVILQAIQDDSHYPRLPTRIAGIEMKWPAAVINVYEAENVRITGPGTIDGNGEYWWHKFWGEDRRGGMRPDYSRRGLRWAVDYDCERVRPVVVWRSAEVLLRGFRIHDSGFWSVSMTYSDRVHVDGVVIRANISGQGPSSDGINTDSSSNILVENCDVDCNDDNFTIKSGKDADGLRVNRPAENIVYRNSITRRGHGMFTLGSETSGGMRNIEVYGLKAEGTTTGIRFKSAKVRGGVMEAIHFHDIEMNEVGTAFKFDLNWFPSYSYPTIPDNIPEAEITDRWRKITERVEPPELGIPEFRNMRFEDITVRNSGTAIQSNGYPEKPTRNFVWKNVSFEVRNAGKISHAADWVMTNNVTLNGEPFRVKTKHTEDMQFPRRTPEKKQIQPNILLIMPDDLGWSDVGYHNKDIRTPNIDQLAKSGIKLAQHYVSPSCTPSRVSLMTGLYPSRYGVLGPAYGEVIDRGDPTLASLLSKNGYFTAIVGKWHLGSPPHTPLKYGFQCSYGYFDGQIDPYTHRYKNGRESWHRNDEYLDEAGHVTDLITEEAVRIIEEDRDKPFFLYVAHHVPHYPLDEPAEWMSVYDDAAMSPSRKLFAASVTHMDDGIGRLIDALERTGKREDTLILFMSDNGGQRAWHSRSEYKGRYADKPHNELGNNSPLRGWKHQLYEGGIRAPAFINWQGHLDPGRIDSQIHISDWLPTLCSLTDFQEDLRTDLDGRNIWPLLTGEKEPDYSRSLYRKSEKGSAIREGQWKLIVHGNRSELFDLENDPYEKHDLSDENPEKVKNLLKLIKEIKKSDR